MVADFRLSILVQGVANHRVEFQVPSARTWGITARFLLRLRVALHDRFNVDGNINFSTIVSLLSDSFLVGGWE